MRSYRYLHYDVFTERLFGGNQLAVFLDGQGLTSDTMQAIAKEMNFSESTFVLPPEQGGTDVRVRIFTPAEELPMAGHPTIGTAFALAATGLVAPARAGVVFGLGVGPIDVSLAWRDAALDFAWMTQLPPAFGTPLDRDAMAAALGLTVGDLAPHPVMVVSCGVPYVLVPLRTRDLVDRASLDSRVYDRFREDAGLAANVCVYLFTTDAGGTDATAYCRMFGLGVGIAEDPATGSAAGPLGCYLVRHGLVTAAERAAMRFTQGVRMGRPSDIHVRVDASGDVVQRVSVGGRAVLAGEGTLRIAEQFLLQ